MNGEHDKIEEKKNCDSANRNETWGNLSGITSNTHSHSLAHIRHFYGSFILHLFTAILFILFYLFIHFLFAWLNCLHIYHTANIVYIAIASGLFVASKSIIGLTNSMNEKTMETKK